jgi:hypothetical protein
MNQTVATSEQPALLPKLEQSIKYDKWREPNLG